MRGDPRATWSDVARRLAAFVLGGAAVLAGALAVVAVASGGHLTVPERLGEAHPSAYADGPPQAPPALVVRGARLTTTDDTPAGLRGVMVPDPAVLREEGRLDADLFAEIAATGANVVRLPVHPGHWRADRDYLWRSLEPAVRHASQAGLWVIVDWHVIGDVEAGTSPNGELFAATRAETEAFWTQVADYFAPAPNVLFELVNESTGPGGDAWRATAQELVDLVRQHSAAPVIVGGTQYSRDLSWVAGQPLRGDGIVYASHVYPAHGKAGWDGWFGDVAAEHPVLLTEWGFTDHELDPDDPYLWGTAEGYAAPLLEYAQARGVGWVACWYDETWNPVMFGAGGEPTPWGAFVLDALAG